MNVFNRCRLLICFFHALMQGCQSTLKTLYIPISQGNRLYQQCHRLNASNECNRIASELYFTFQQTFDNPPINELLLGCNTLWFQGLLGGSGDQKRSPGTLIAPYFGLDENANLKVYLDNGRMRNTIANIQVSFETNCFWGQVDIPLVSCTQYISKCPITSGEYGSAYTAYNNQSGAVSIVTPTPANGTKNFLEANGTTSIINSLMLIDYFDNNLDMCFSIDNEENPTIVNLPIGLNFYGKTRFYRTETVDSEPLVRTANPTNLADFFFTSEVKTSSETLGIEMDPFLPATNIEQALEGYLYGDLKERLYNKFSFGENCSNNRLGCADVHVQFGYSPYKSEKGSCGIYLKGVIPAGTIIDKAWTANLFSPVIGNGHHFELGGGANCSFSISTGECNFGLHADGYVTHLFTNTQFRTFDKTNEPLSRYALVKELIYDPTVTPTLENNQFFYTHNTYALGDINADYVQIAIDAQTEIMVDFFIQNRNKWFSCGYCYAGLSSESSTPCCNSNVNQAYYGYKGQTCNDDILFYMETPDNSRVTYFLFDGALIEPPPSGQQNGSDIKYKTSDSVVQGGKGGVYNYGTATGSANNLTSLEDVFQLPDINCSGIMQGQSSHRIFATISYCYDVVASRPEIGFSAAVWQNKTQNTSIFLWECGFNVGLVF